MNNRIKEIIESAFNGLENDPVLISKHEDLQKFAKLIVMECIQIADPEDSYRDVWFEGKADSVNKIKEHFGVK